jgi:hypothetical protein
MRYSLEKIFPIGLSAFSIPVLASGRVGRVTVFLNDFGVFTGGLA